jgi:hypothetical protein
VTVNPADLPILIQGPFGGELQTSLRLQAVGGQVEEVRCLPGKLVATDDPSVVIPRAKVTFRGPEGPLKLNDPVDATLAVTAAPRAGSYIGRSRSSRRGSKRRACRSR